MAERETTVGPKEGLHARPAAEFVQKAKGFSSAIVVEKDGREANAKSPLKLMTLAAKHGDKITIRAEGDDAQEAVDSLVEQISRTSTSIQHAALRASLVSAALGFSTALRALSARHLAARRLVSFSQH